MSNTNTVAQGTLNLNDISGNPAPLGLLGFGMTTVLLNLHNAGFISLGAMILAMGICYGGIAQIIAGMMEWRKGNTFATTAFISYGFFWLSLVALLVLPKMGLVDQSDNLSMVFYLGMWGLFTFFMFIATLKLHKSLQVIFFLLTILFFMLAAGDYYESHLIKVAAGYEGILCGLSAIYAAVAQVINEVYGKTIMPV
jgi:succinate-acetate transporter protein